MWYKDFLEDKNRLRKLRAAIFEVVKPGDTVIDIGSGVGTLSFFACQAGAKKVHALEDSNAITIAQEIAKNNNEFSKKISFINKHSTDLISPIMANTIISECNIEFGSRIFETIADAKKRFLKKGGKIVPKALNLFLSPVFDKRYYTNISCWEKDVFGIDFRPGKKIALSQIIDVNVKPDAVMDNLKPCYKYNFYSDHQKHISFKITFRPKVDQTIYGFVGWYDYYLIDDIKITNEPGKNSCWGGQLFFPLEKPVRIENEDEVMVKMDNISLGKNYYWSWKTTIIDSDGKIKAQFSQNNIDESYAKKILEKAK